MLLLPPTFAWFLLLFLPTSSSSASSSPTCLPLCCDDAELGANGSDACAAVAMVDGSSMSGADVCTAGFYSADGFRPMRAPPRCSGEATPREVGLEKAPKQLRGRMITKSLYEVQGKCSIFFLQHCTLPTISRFDDDLVLTTSLFQ